MYIYLNIFITITWYTNVFEKRTFMFVGSDSDVAITQNRSIKENPLSRTQKKVVQAVKSILLAVGTDLSLIGIQINILRGVLSIQLKGFSLNGGDRGMFEERDYCAALIVFLNT